jgi:hypothetical protein
MPQRTIVELLTARERTSKGQNRAIIVANEGQAPRRSKLVQPDRYDLGGELHLVAEMIGVVGRAGDQAQEQEQAEA